MLRHRLLSLSLTVRGTRNCWERNRFGSSYPSPLPRCETAS